MKKITLLFACIVAFSGVISAQDSRSIAEVPNTTNNPVYSQGDPVTTTATVLFEKPMGAQDYSSFVSSGSHTVTSTHGPAIISGQRGAMAVTPYTDRATFQAAYSGTLISEDFAGGPGAGAITPCGPVVSSSGDGCFPAGELVDGFNITASVVGNDVIYIGSGAIGNTSTLMGANTFADFTILTFTPDGAYAAGIDLWTEGVSNADVRVYDMGGGLLDTFVVSNTPSTENFFGVISDDAIGKIEIQAEADAGELFGNMEFGIDPIGGGGGACDEENPNDGTFENGFNCSSAAAFMTANDVTVAADENFTLENITASIFANGGISNVDVNYYDDAAGLPGSLIGSEASVTIDNQAVIGSNFGFDVNEVEMSVTPFTFNGQAGVPTTYWIELSVTDGGATGSVFWVVTSSTAIGNPTAQFDGAAWGIPDPLMDGVYIWSGTCDSLGVSDNALAGFSYYPNPATEVLSLKSASNIESVSLFNLLGQQVISTEIGATTSDINLSGLTAGTYIMKVTVDGQTGTYKVLKN